MDVPMPYKLVPLLPLQIVRMLRLDPTVEPAPLDDGKHWGLLVRERGSTTFLREDLIAGPDLMRPAGYHLSRSREYYSEASAVLAAQSLGLLP